jgi:hypothetical protein
MSASIDFAAAMTDVYRRAKSELGYNATYFLSMLSELGPQETARRLVMATSPSDGFTTLLERKRLDLTVEAVILRPEFQELFTAEEVERARDRLQQYGWSDPQPG